jgi:GNAT superfamily N-acetyltransferase
VTFRFRPMTRADVPACADVVYQALDELSHGLQRPPGPRNPAALGRLLDHLLGTDPQGAWLAERGDSVVGGGAVVGMGLAVRRDRFWFLSFLFVLHEAQGRGVGRELLRRCLPVLAELRGGTVTDGDAPVVATCVDALQPISTGLYATHGIVPRVPLFSLTGRPPNPGLPALPRGVESIPFETVALGESGRRRLAEALESVDRSVLGFARAKDHLFRGQGRHGRLYRAPGSADVLGYGYVQPAGSIGPVALRDMTLMPGVVADLMACQTPPGPWQLLVPGVNEHALVPLLRAGFRLDGSPAIFCSSRPGPRLEGYLLAGFGLP